MAPKKAPMKQVSADDIKQYINALTTDSFEQKAVSCCGCSSTYATPQGLQKHLKGHGAADEDLKPLLDNHEVDPVHQVGHKDEHAKGGGGEARPNQPSKKTALNPILLVIKSNGISKHVLPRFLASCYNVFTTFLNTFLAHASKRF